MCFFKILKCSTSYMHHCSVPKTRYFIMLSTMIICFLLSNTRNIFKHKDKKIGPISSSKLNKKNDSIKYILFWTWPEYFSFNYDDDMFDNSKKRCEWNNCFLTHNKYYLRKYTDYDVVAFDGTYLSLNNETPTERNSYQKYVYVNIDAAKNYPIEDTISQRFQEFFNWTWTYKLNSDVVWSYFVVKDSNNNVIGPKENMHWISEDNMEPIDELLKFRLQTKRKAAVWFSSNCVTLNRRELYVYSLQNYLSHYNMELDVYGKCGLNQCPKELMQQCLNMVRREYYFYLAFENAFSDDYVTEKIVYALNSDAVPVVYGGANYSRFLPEGIYLDAVKLSPKVLAKTMYEIIQNPERYYKFFRWRKYYSFHLNTHTDVYCKICAIVNNDTLMRSYSVYENFSIWWMNDVNLIKVPDFHHLYTT